MSQISQESVERAVKTTANTVLEHYHYFSDLDGLAGDGDFGASLQSGFKHLAGENFEALNRASIGDLLLNISMIISKNVGGCSGPIWGTGFMRAAMKSKGKDAVTLGEFAEMLGSAIEGIQARGGAQLGDKTLLDALIPIHERLIEHAANESADLAVALKDCADIAEGAIDATKSLEARRGRQSQVGERSSGTPDPGIVAIACILQDWCQEYGVDRTPAAKEVAQRSV